MNSSTRNGNLGKAIGAILLAMVLAASLTMGAVASAEAATLTTAATKAGAVKSAKKTTKKSAAFKMKKYKVTKKYRYAKAYYLYQKPVLKGKTKAVKKINSSLKRAYKSSLKNKKMLMNYAKNARSVYKGAKFSWTTKTKATYNKNGLISFRSDYFWFAGGVNNRGTKGYVYSLKTGKKLNVSDVVAGTAPQIKMEIANKYYSIEQNYTAYRNMLAANIGDFQFFLQNGNVVVTFPKYSFGRYGYADAKSITLKGNYE